MSEIKREIKFRAFVDWGDPGEESMMEVVNLLWENGGLFFKAKWPNGSTISSRIGSEFGNFLMQYTGLRDKSGREIYEGDILDGLFECFWNSSTAEFLFRKFNSPCAGFGKEFCLNREVIGNIYENPELLKKEK